MSAVSCPLIFTMYELHEHFQSKSSFNVSLSEVEEKARGAVVTCDALSAALAPCVTFSLPSTASLARGCQISTLPKTAPLSIMPANHLPWVLKASIACAREC